MSDQRAPQPSLPNSAFATQCPTCGEMVGAAESVCRQCGTVLTGPAGTVVVNAGSTVVTTGGGVEAANSGSAGAGAVASGPVASPAAASGASGSAPASSGGSAGTTPGGSPAENAERLRARVQDAVGEDFRLIELLGRGGMGIVFRATETALDREVALKVLAIDPLLAPDAYERFEREAKLAARLDHPNIVPIFSVGRRESVAFYTMRLVRGGSVEDMMESRPRFEYDHAISILREVAAALDYAHGRGVVHRDIKPGNILIGETGHALVADFGIAKALGNTSKAGATGTGIIGSPGYMSPEQWKGDGIDGRADQYALAVVAFEMFAGRRPFDSPNMQELLQKHLAGEIPAVSTYRFGLHEGVDDALRRALAKDPAERFATATAFVDALSGLRPAMATMRSARVPRYEPPRKPKRRWIGVAALALLLGGGAAAFAAPQTRPQAIRYASAARASATTLIERVRYAIVPPPLVVSADSLAAMPGTGIDSSLMLAGASPLVDSIGDSVSLALEGAGGALVSERQPVAVDPQLYGEEPSPFRPARPLSEVGWVRVVLHGGVAPIVIDGETVSGMARPAGHLVRLETGRHYVSVRGAGTLYVPSQVAIEISAGDTAQAVFAVPQAIVTQPAPPPAAAVTPPDTAGGDSTAAAPPQAAGPAASRPDSARQDSTRPDTTRPDTTRRPPPR